MLSRAWYLKSDLVLEFARVLEDGDFFGGESDNALHYFEKPYKWDGAHDVWLKHQRPHEGEEGWRKFLDEVDRMQVA